jgi:polyphosphate kinase 2 (PPK2 family)
LATQSCQSSRRGQEFPERIYLIKYWFSVSDDEQERRFQERIRNPIKRWKLSPMDVESRKRWVEYSRAKDVMFAHTDRKKTPWRVNGAYRNGTHGNDAVAIRKLIAALIKVGC